MNRTIQFLPQPFEDCEVVASRLRDVSNGLLLDGDGDDASTHELMTDFYGRLLAGETDELAAFTAAKKALRAKYPDTVVGFAAPRPLQQEAIDAALEGCDALVVLPEAGERTVPHLPQGDRALRGCAR